MLLHRVFAYLPAAREHEPGGALHVPAIQGAGRLDNPEQYRTMYLADDPAGAVGEALARAHSWTPSLLQGPPALPGSVRALGTYEAATTLLNLDDPHELAARDLPPSRVVTHDRPTTQAWALRIWDEQRWDGIRWWSYWHADWGSVGIWHHDALRVTKVEPLHAEHPALVAAAGVLNRPWRASR